jgi:hypothetical protein
MTEPHLVMSQLAIQPVQMCLDEQAMTTKQSSDNDHPRDALDYVSHVLSTARAQKMNCNHVETQ